MKRTNKKGGAAIVAVLIVIMLVAVGSAALVVTGRYTIQASKVADAVVKVNSKPEESSSEEVSEVDDLSSVVEEPVSNYPVKSANYQDINIKGMTANSAILVDADTNEIVAGYNYEKKVYPASLTKMLTLLVAAENIQDMDATYKFTSDDIDPLIEDNASRAGFEAGETVTMKDLLYSAILVSGADGTTGLANAVAGSEEKFVELMNAKIQELGLTGTKFVKAVCTTKIIIPQRRISQLSQRRLWKTKLAVKCLQQQSTQLQRQNSTRTVSSLQALLHRELRATMWIVTVTARLTTA